jgi:rRNA-processing protein EBP2
MASKTQKVAEPKKRAQKNKAKLLDAPAPGPSKQNSVKEDKPVHTDSDSELEGGEDDGVNEEGMAKLMELLGEDGLDELGQMQLDALGGDEDDSEDEEDGSEETAGKGENAGVDEQSDEGEESESEEQGEGEEKTKLDGESDSSSDEESVEDAGEGEDIAEVALEDAESVDEDAVPRQKLVINNKVSDVTIMNGHS